MSPHIDTSDPKYKAAAAEILRRHDNGEPEANITTAVRNFLTITGLVKDEELVSTKRDWETFGTALPERYDMWTVTRDVRALQFEIECGIPHQFSQQEGCR